LRYALLVYNDREALDRRSAAEQERITAAIIGALGRPSVGGWLQLHDSDSATTVRREHQRTLLTDGPFVDSKDYLGGLILVEADSLDGALAVADDLQEIRGAGAIEIRPIRGGELSGA